MSKARASATGSWAKPLRLFARELFRPFPHQHATQWAGMSLGMRLTRTYKGGTLAGAEGHVVFKQWLQPGKVTQVFDIDLQEWRTSHFLTSTTSQVQAAFPRSQAAFV